MSLHMNRHWNLLRLEKPYKDLHKPHSQINKSYQYQSTFPPCSPWVSKIFSVLYVGI